jgi:hypothetical protein
MIPSIKRFDEGGKMARNKVNQNSNGTDDGTAAHVTQDTPPTPPLPWDNGRENRKRFQKFFQDFKIGIAVGIVLSLREVSLRDRQKAPIKTGMR